MNAIAAAAKIGLQTRLIGRIFANSGIWLLVSKVEDLLKIFSVIALAVKLAMAIGASARIEKWRKTASCAKIMPARGAPNPAEMAPATPQPIKTSVDNRSLVIAFKEVPIVAPKWTSGPYNPTEEPPLALIRATKDDK